MYFPLPQSPVHPFSYSFPLCFSSLISHSPQGIYYWWNMISLPMSSMVPALECKEGHHQQSNTPWELFFFFFLRELFAMGLVCSQHCPCFSCWILTTLTGRHYYPHITCKAQMVKMLCSRLHSKCWGQDPNPELTTSTPRLYRRPHTPTPWAALHQTSDSKPSGMLSQSTAAALTPPLLNQPPRESKLGDSGEYYWLKYLVSHKAVSSVTWGRPTGKSYIHDCVCMHVSIVL